MHELSAQDFAFFLMAACAGAFLRYTLSFFFSQVTCRFTISCPTPFPWGVFVVNLLGCFGFGLTVGFSQNHFSLSPSQQFFIFTGFFGSFTTFSTLIFELYTLWKNKIYIPCIYFILGQILGGIFLVFLGIEIFSKI